MFALVTHSGFLIKAALGLIQLSLESGLGLGKSSIAAVQILHLSLELEVLLSQSSLESIQVVVLARQVINLGLQSSDHVIHAIQLALGVGTSLLGSIQVGGDRINLDEQSLLFFVRPDGLIS